MNIKFKTTFFPIFPFFFHDVILQHTAIHNYYFKKDRL